MAGAINAIGAIGGVTELAPTGKTHAIAAAAPAATDFTSVLGSMITDTAQNLRAGEAASAAGIQGRLSTQAVVEAIMSAERSLQTTMAVRDKVVAAYQEISRMAI